MGGYVFFLFDEQMTQRAYTKESGLREGIYWSAANGGVTNGGLRGVWPPVLEIGRNRPFSPFFCLFRPFPEGPESTWKIQKKEGKGLFPQISSDLLTPPSLKPPFAALQIYRGQKTAQEKNKFLGTEVPKNFSDQCSLDFACFLCVFSGRRAKKSRPIP